MYVIIFIIPKVPRGYTRYEVLLSPGIFLPTLLDSGFGYYIDSPIHMVHNLPPGVDENMLDHIGVAVVYACPFASETVHTAIETNNLSKTPLPVLCSDTGLLASQDMEAACFVRLNDIVTEFVAREQVNRAR
jgi:choline dehydrogenase